MTSEYASGEIPSFIEEVVEGSPNDPFSVNYNGGSSAPAATPAQPVNGQPVVQTQDGQQFQIAPQQVPTQVVERPQAPAPASTNAGMTRAEVEALFAQREADLKAAAEAEAQTALQRARAAQSAADQRAAELERQLREAQEAQRKADREARLESPELSDDDREALRKTWALEDRQAELDAREAELDAYHRELYIVALEQEHAQYGVTAAQLEQFATPELMDAFVEARKVAYEAAGLVTQTQVVPSSPPVAQPNGGAVQQRQTAPPPGATLPADTVSAPPPPSRPAFRTDASRDALRDNLEAMEWETLRVPQ